MDRIKWLLGEVLAILAFITFGWMRAKNQAAEQIRRETEQQAMQLQQQANKAMRDGLANEQKKRDEVANHPHIRVDLE